jgi:hypothetical protein
LQRAKREEGRNGGLERPFERAGGATGTDWRKSFDLQDGNLPWTHTEQTALEPLNEAIIMESTSKPLLKNPPAFAGIIYAASTSETLARNRTMKRHK